MACGRSNPATLAPNVGLLRPGQDTEGLSKLHWSHQPRQRTATSAPAPPERQRRPAEERGRQRSYRHRQPPVASLPRIQPGAAQASRPSARGPGAQGTMLQEEMGEGINASSPWWRGVPIRTVPGPPRSYLRGPAVGPPPLSPSSQPLQPASPSDTSASLSSSPRPPVSGTEGEGGVGV